jgi:hypothetical protein
MLSSTNIAMLRTSDKLSKQMGLPQDLPVNPANLPAEWPDGSSTAGLGYLATAAARVSPVRVAYVEDPYYWANDDIEVAQLEPSAVEDAGEGYATWRERRAAGADEDDETGPTTTHPQANHAPSGDRSPAAAPRQGTTRSAILTYLQCSGQIRTGVLAADLDVPLPTVSSTLRRLERDGLAVQVGHGIWAHADYSPTELVDVDEADVA